MGQGQAYFDSDQVLASSDGLDAEPLRAALPGGDGLRVSVVEGVGLVAARRVEDFTHVVAGLDGSYPIELTGWHENPGEFEAFEARPVDLSVLAEAPHGVATRLLDAALAGPVVFSEPDAARREAWIAWLSYALPGGAGLTFSTAGDEDVRVRVADVPDAIDTAEPCDLPASFYARVALALATRGGLREAVSRLEEPDGLALAVHGGATDLIAPHQLPLALQLITELATSGHVHEAARAAAALPTHTAQPSTSLVLREEIPALPEVVEAELEEDIPEAEVVEPDPLEDDEVIEVPFERAPAEPIEDDDVISVPFEPAVDEPPEKEEPLPDLDAWSSLLRELKSESVDSFAASLRGAPEPESEDEVLKEEEVGMSLAELEEALKRKGDL